MYISSSPPLKLLNGGIVASFLLKEENYRLNSLITYAEPEAAVHLVLSAYNHEPSRQKREKSKELLYNTKAWYLRLRDSWEGLLRETLLAVFFSVLCWIWNSHKMERNKDLRGCPRHYPTLWLSATCVSRKSGVPCLFVKQGWLTLKTQRGEMGCPKSEAFWNR